MPYPAKLTPDAIATQARVLLEGGGPEALNMRPLADALGVRPSSLYRHYADRAALLSALTEIAARELRAAMAGAAAGLDPQAGLLAMAGAYHAYARAHPHLYALLLDPARPYAPAGPLKDLWNTVLEQVSAVTGRPDDTGATVAVWAFLHGHTLLFLGGQFGPSGDQGGFRRGLEALVCGLLTA
ncbi:TetR/AcrR family transcriptional regulator [uncultured Deinococcus sp.]|uniref:TetR/AcrR family transcriptional regulator n=1 Tax=uncultured Deinococcus sp. TaxID=158789 RepID=UPI00258EAC55|nr:TetR/AcrR family transcriptional regulator [uncultured Deinococcus sp.]